MGMHPPFAASLTFTIIRTRAGAVVAYDRSLEDGSVIDAVTVPVTLKP